MFPERYEYVADLNKGSYGVVCLAKDKHNDDKLVAVKSIRSRLDAKQEIAVHEILGNGNKNVTPLLDHFTVGEETFLVMEYYQQGDVYESIRAGRGPKEQGSIREFMYQLIDAVEYCHQRGVYHRDIKPENLLVDDDNNVKLADFGLATTARVSTDFGVGSERYMAPELFDQEMSKDYDALKVDIWSIGICLLNVIFCRNPFTVASAKDKLFLDFASNREALFDIFPTLSTDTFACLRHCLTLDPNNRSLEKMRQEMANVKSWTIDDDFDEDYEDYEDEDLFGDSSSRVIDSQESVDDASTDEEPTTTLNDTIITTTTTNRQPLRTPSIDVAGGYFEPSSKPWVRTMQFTPPTTSALHDYCNHSFGKNKPSGLRHHSMESVSEDDEHDGDNGHREDENDDVDDDLAYDSHDDIFVMDMNTSMSKMSVRNSSDNGSIDSVPSLVQSTTSTSQLSTSAPGWTIPTAKTPPSREFLQFGTSWSDMAFEDDLLDDKDDQHDDCDFGYGIVDDSQKSLKGDNNKLFGFLTANSKTESPVPGAKDIRSGWNKIIMN